MLFQYDKSTKNFSVSEETDFGSNEILERQDIEKWVLGVPEILGEELLVITNEYDQFDRTRERLDLLALDKNGKLVVVELKRDDSGRAVELQALKYAAYCSTLTLDELVPLRRAFVARTGQHLTDEEIKQKLYEFIEDEEFEELDDRPRIILVAKDFRLEVTSSVLWLRKFGLDISCIKLVPYKIDATRIGLVSSTLIPIPEAEEYIVRTEKKESTENTSTRREREYEEFYRQVAEGFRDKTGVVISASGSRSYYQIPIGVSGVHFEWSFHGRPRSSFGVELHFERSNRTENASVLNALEPIIPEVEKQTGEKVVIQREWGKAWSRLYLERHHGEIDADMTKWAVEKMVILYRLLYPELEKLKPKTSAHS